MEDKMQLSNQEEKRYNFEVNSIESTQECITGRAGLLPILKYIEETRILSRFNYKFQHLKHSTKGVSIDSFFKQITAYMIDGSKLNLVAFDELKKDPSYAALLEMDPKELMSSHQVKRMFQKFCNESRHIDIFRDAITDTFISHLQEEKPPVVIIGVDTMVMDNDQAEKREGCSPTYKKVKGFQPLEFYWNGMIIDAIFREGKCHSNHGDDVQRATKDLLRRSRRDTVKQFPSLLKWIPVL
jgi:hypothetical protein